MVDGEQTRLGEFDAAVMLRLVVRTLAPIEAVMVALPLAFALTAALNPADDAPGGTDTEDGTVTWALLLLNETLAPDWPAGPLKDTEQELALPAFTVNGLQLTDAREDWPVTATEKFTEEPA